MSPRSTRSLLPAAFAAIALAGCGAPPSTEGNGDGNGNANANASATTIAIAGTVRDAQTGAGIDGVRVCLAEPTAGPCVDTAQGGAYRLAGIPMESRVALTFEHAGDLPTLLPLWTAHRDIDHDQRLLSGGAWMAMSRKMSDPLRADRAAIVIDTAPSTVDAVAAKDVTLTLAGVVADGPLYLDDAGEPDRTLRATSSRGLAIILNAVVAPATIQVAHHGLLCAGYRGWPTNRVDTVELPLRAGFVTAAGTACVTP